VLRLRGWARTGREIATPPADAEMAAAIEALQMLDPKPVRPFFSRVVSSPSHRLSLDASHRAASTAITGSAPDKPRWHLMT